MKKIKTIEGISKSPELLITKCSRSGSQAILGRLEAKSNEANSATTSAPTKRCRARLRLKSDEMFVNTKRYIKSRVGIVTSCNKTNVECGFYGGYMYVKIM